MGNSNSASVELTHPAAGCQPATYPRDIKRGKSSKRNINGLSPENKVLPELVAGARLRQTRLGAILQSGGTITGRKKESLKTAPQPPNVSRSLQPSGRTTPQPINIPLHYSKLQPQPYLHASRRMSSILQATETEDYQTFVKKFDSEPDLRESELPSYHPSPIKQPPTKSKIKARKNKRAPPPPGNERAQSLPRESEPTSLPDFSGKSIVKVQQWQQKQETAPEELSKKGPFKKLRLFKSKSDGKKLRGEEGSDLSSRKSAPPGTYEWDLQRKARPQDKNQRYYWNPEKMLQNKRARSLDCIQAQLQTRPERLQQGKSLECISQIPSSRFDSTLDKKIDSKRNRSQKKLDETLSSEGSSGKRSSRLDAYKEPAFTKVVKAQVEQRPEYAEPEKVVRKHSHHRHSDFQTEIKAAVQRRLSQRLSGESVGQTERNEVYRSPSKTEKPLPKQFFFGMDSDYGNQQPTRTGPKVFLNGNSVEYKRGTDKNYRDRSLSKDSFVEERRKSAERYMSYESSSPKESRKLSREVDRFASVIQQKQKKLEEKSELLKEENHNEESKSTSSSDGEVGVLMHLRPTLPRKQVEIPRFSPSAAWRAIRYGSSESPNPSSEEHEGDIFEDRIRLSSRPVAPRRISNEKSGDSGISGDAGSPGLLHEFDMTISDKMKRSDASMRPLAVSSPVPPISAHSSLIKAKHWTPEQDLEGSIEGSVENSPISSPERFTSGVTTPPKLSNMFTGYSKTYPQEYLNKDSSDEKSTRRKEENLPTPNTFNSLRKLKRTMSNLANKRGKSPDNIQLFDENWSLSRSVPSSLNKPETEMPVRARTWSVDKLRDSPKNEHRQSYSEIPLHQVRPAGFNRLFGANRHIMYLPEYNSVKPETDSPQNIPDTRNITTEVIYSNINQGGEIYRAWETPQQQVSEPTKRKGKRFTFNSTVRQQERKRLEVQLNREAEEKERQRKKEMELMQKVEQEFQLKRNREKANIRQQLRLIQIQNQETDFSQRYSDDSNRYSKDRSPTYSEEFSQQPNSDVSLGAEITANKQTKENNSQKTQEYANIEVIRKHRKPGYLITRRPSTKNPNSEQPPPPPISPPPPVTPDEYLSIPVQFDSSSSQQDLDSSDTSRQYRKDSNRVFSGISKWMKAKSKGSPKSSSPTESRSLSPTRQEPDGAAEPDHKKGEDFRREIIAASKTRAGETSPDSSQISSSLTPERKISIYKHLSDVAEKEERKNLRQTGDKEKGRSSSKTVTHVPMTQELSEYKEERREYREYRARTHKQPDTSSDGHQANGPSRAISSDNYRLGFAIGSSQGSSREPSDSDYQERKDGWSGSRSELSTPHVMRFGVVQPFNPKPGYRPVSFTPKTAPVS